jgi:DNA-binding XRE family transcriptional regulator
MRMGDTPVFDQWLKQRRKTLGLTQDTLARLVGCATITIQKLEAGALRPSVQIAAPLAEHLPTGRCAAGDPGWPA